MRFKTRRLASTRSIAAFHDASSLFKHIFDVCQLQNQRIYSFRYIRVQIQPRCTKLYTSALRVQGGQKRQWSENNSVGAFPCARAVCTSVENTMIYGVRVLRITPVTLGLENLPSIFAPTFAANNLNFFSINHTIIVINKYIC